LEDTSITPFTGKILPVSDKEEVNTLQKIHHLLNKFSNSSEATTIWSKSLQKNSTYPRFWMGMARLWQLITFFKNSRVTKPRNVGSSWFDSTSKYLLYDLAIDVWEHAYYIDYKNVRLDYVKQIWKIVNWKDAERRHLAATKKWLYHHYSFLTIRTVLSLSFLYLTKSKSEREQSKIFEVYVE